MVSNLITLSDAGLPGVGSGEAKGDAAPSCSVDLVSGQVSCIDLNAFCFCSGVGRAFAVSNRSGGAPVVLSTQQTSAGQGGYVGTYRGTAFLSGVEAGDVITLDETSPTLTTRHITALNVYTLRTDTISSGARSSVSADCRPGKAVRYYGEPAGVCPTSGDFAGLLGLSGEFDDLSGGSTVVNVPSAGNVIPSYSDSV